MLLRVHEMEAGISFDMYVLGERAMTTETCSSILPWIDICVYLIHHPALRTIECIYVYTIRKEVYIY